MHLPEHGIRWNLKTLFGNLIVRMNSFIRPPQSGRLFYFLYSEGSISYSSSLFFNVLMEPYPMASLVLFWLPLNNFNTFLMCIFSTSFQCNDFSSGTFFIRAGRSVVSIFSSLNT